MSRNRNIVQELEQLEAYTMLSVLNSRKQRLADYFAETQEMVLFKIANPIPDETYFSGLSDRILTKIHEKEKPKAKVIQLLGYMSTAVAAILIAFLFYKNMEAPVTQSNTETIFASRLVQEDILGFVEMYPEVTMNELMKTEESNLGLMSDTDEISFDEDELDYILQEIITSRDVDFEL